MATTSWVDRGTLKGADGVGTPGVRGNRISFGTGAPTSTTFNDSINGDIYIDQATFRVYTASVS